MKKTTLTIGIILAVLYGFSLLSRIYWGSGEGEAQIIIAKGDTLVDIAGQLVASEVLVENDIWLFDLYARITDKDRAIKAGEFTLAQSMPIADILGALSVSSGSEKTLTFIEGWDLRDIAEYLIEQEVIDDEEDLYEVTGIPARDYRTQKGKPSVPFEAIAYEKPSWVSLEGFLFPETYRVYSNATVDEVIETMVDEFANQIGDTKEQYKDYTFYEMLVMASILEAEVQSSEDRRLVADIMWRRLENGWPLQVDSSVNYVLDKNNPSASAQDLKADSPYNTYKNKGLPIGPINNPSADSFDAALNPKANDYWFFLTSPDGTVHYARTIEEHAANRKYL